LRRLPDQLFQRRLDDFCRFCHDLPLGGGRQWNPETRLQLFFPISRTARGCRT
jgi:hypothetical protein